MYSSRTPSCILDPYVTQPRLHEILHIKCPIIRLVRFQMTNMNQRLSNNVELFERRNRLSYKLWRNRWTIISCILMIFLMTSLFLYGTLVGAGLCSASSWNPSYNSPCPKTFTLFPLVNKASKRSRLPY